MFICLVLHIRYQNSWLDNALEMPIDKVIDVTMMDWTKNPSSFTQSEEMHIDIFFVYMLHIDKAPGAMSLEGAKNSPTLIQQILVYVYAINAHEKATR